jgi:hypothetical protein
LIKATPGQPLTLMFLVMQKQKAAEEHKRQLQQSQVSLLVEDCAGSLPAMSPTRRHDWSRECRDVTPPSFTMHAPAAHSAATAVKEHAGMRKLESTEAKTQLHNAMSLSSTPNRCSGTASSKSTSSSRRRERGSQ